MNYEL